MFELRPEDIYHKSQLNRLLIEIVDEPILAHALGFKGGTCAAMLGYLDRFSVDLDFDYLAETSMEDLRPIFHGIFDKLGLTITLENKKALFFQLRYSTSKGQRSTLKVSASNRLAKSNQYKVQFFPEIERLVNSQTIETMFANKLVAVTDRYKQHKSIAGRDIYDIHHFFMIGLTYNPSIIEERTNLSVQAYFTELIEFIRKHINQTLINEDLNSLLPSKKFQQIRKILIPETISLLENAIRTA